MSLIQIAAQELAAPGTHRHKTNTPREVATATDRANKFVSLSPVEFLLWNQIERQVAVAASHDGMAELLFIGREDPARTTVKLGVFPAIVVYHIS
jgi:hypothetical protein